MTYPFAGSILSKEIVFSGDSQRLWSPRVNFVSRIGQTSGIIISSSVKLNSHPLAIALVFAPCSIFFLYCSSVSAATQQCALCQAAFRSFTSGRLLYSVQPFLVRTWFLRFSSRFLSNVFCHLTGSARTFS